MEEKKNETGGEYVNPALAAFLDAGTLYEKLRVLKEHREEIDVHVITSCAVSLDIVLKEGTLEEQYDELISCLETMKKFETGRLY